jgi:hypothetical protein
MQGINLYEPAGGVTGGSWNVLIFGVIPLTAVLIFGLISEFQQRRHAQLIDELGKAELGTHHLKARWLALKVQLMASETESPDRSVALQNKLRASRQLLQALQAADLDESSTFLPPLVALAKLTPPEISIHQISLDSDSAVRLAGHARSPTAAARFVGQLRSTPAFLGKALAPVLVQSVADKDHYEFVIGTAAGSKDSANRPVTGPSSSTAPDLAPVATVRQE